MILIPLIRTGENDELRYCLRGIAQYHPEQEVMIAGHLPQWVRNVQHVPFRDNQNYEYKTRNIYLKILEAFKHSDRVLFFNDDHFIQAQVDYVHHKGQMTMAGRNASGTYARLLQNTMETFPGCNDYDTHCPIWYERDKFAKLAALDWDRHYAYGIKTAYCVLNGIAGEHYPDLKFTAKVIISQTKGRPYFSTSDSCDIRPLAQLYPNKSKFEA